jgi:hypothetical protein
MTHYQLDREPTTFDVRHELVNARIADIQDEMRRSRMADAGPPNGAIRWLRHGLGLRLIALGSALLTERRPRPLTR